MTEGFLATVVSGAAKEWIVTPKITEDDGTPHPDITVSAQNGITPDVGDTVLVLTMKNNLDESDVPRFFSASEANGVIIGVLTTATGFTLTGDFSFIGDVLIEGDLSITGDMEITGDIDITGSLTVNGVDLGPNHTHAAGAYTNGGGPVTGVSGTVVP